MGGGCRRWFLACLQGLRWDSPPPTVPLVFGMFTGVTAPFLESWLLESSLLRTSWGGLPPPPTPPLAFRMFKGLKHTFLNHHLFEHHGGGCRPPQPPRWFLECLQGMKHPFLSHGFLNHHFFEHHRGAIYNVCLFNLMYLSNLI